MNCTRKPAECCGQDLRSFTLSADLALCVTVAKEKDAASAQEMAQEPSPFLFWMTHFLTTRNLACLPNSARQALTACTVVIVFSATHFFTCKYFPCLPNSARQALIASAVDIWLLVAGGTTGADKAAVATVTTDRTIAYLSMACALGKAGEKGQSAPQSGSIQRLADA
jgi:hypothetical protein